MKENKINYLLIAIAFILGFGIMFTISIFTKEKCEVCEKCETKEETKSELTEEETKMFTDLNKVATEMYEKKQYLNLSKNNQGVIVATLADLKNLNYDVSAYSQCSDDAEMIFFDVDHKMAQQYEKEPIQVIVSCEKVIIPNDRNQKREN